MKSGRIIHELFHTLFQAGLRICVRALAECNVLGLATPGSAAVSLTAISGFQGHSYTVVGAAASTVSIYGGTVHGKDSDVIKTLTVLPFGVILLVTAVLSLLIGGLLPISGIFEGLPLAVVPPTTCA